MHRRILSLALLGFLGIVVVNWSCTKLDTTSLGSDLLPVVDNVNTFADTLSVDALQKEYEDTVLVLNIDDHAIGNINSDALFGKSTATAYMQFKPNGFPYSFGKLDSIVGMDSVVLCLNYKSFWGDSTIPQTFEVYRVVDNVFKDSIYKEWRVNEPAPALGAIISAQPVTVDIRRMADTFKYAYINATNVNQIRIKLDAGFAAELFNSDSIATGLGNHAFYNDSAFRRAFNGFAVKSTGGGDAFLYTSLSDTNTKLEVHYRLKNAGKIDTTYKSFTVSVDNLGSVVKKSSTANIIDRNRSGTASLTPPSTEIYLQTQPGTYAALKIPQLTGYSNRVIHRAELIVEEIPQTPPNSIFTPPFYLYLDLKDTGTAIPTRYKTLYYDLNPSVPYDPDFTSGYPYFPTGGPDFGYFGGFLRTKTGTFGEPVRYYNFNISRYIQKMVINQSANYELRLLPAFDFHYPQYSTAHIGYSNSIGDGRVRVGSGTNANYPMRLRIIYSKIK